MHAFFIGSLPEPGTAPELERGESDHLFRTLRARPGDRVRLLDGRGGAGIAVVEAERRLRLLERDLQTPPSPRFRLACAAPRRQKLDTLLKQAVETGVGAIDLIFCERSVAKPEGSERWESLLKEGCKQSGNRFLPRVTVRRSLSEFLTDAAGPGRALYYGATDGGGRPEPPPADAEEIVWIVGPEGGFAPAELAELAAAGAKPLSLGPVIMRLETAAICGIAALRMLKR